MIKGVTPGKYSTAVIINYYLKKQVFEVIDDIPHNYLTGRLTRQGGGRGASTTTYWWTDSQTISEGISRTVKCL